MLARMSPGKLAFAVLAFFLAAVGSLTGATRARAQRT